MTELKVEKGVDSYVSSHLPDLGQQELRKFTEKTYESARNIYQIQATTT